MKQALILAAGCSRRLSDLTKDKPKCFLKVGRATLIERNLMILSKHGFDEVIIGVGYLRDIFKELLGDNKYGIKIRYVDCVDYETTGHGYTMSLLGEAWKENKQPCALIQADTIYDSRILDLVVSSKFSDVIAIDNHPNYIISDGVFIEAQEQCIKSLFRGSWNEHTTGQLIGVHKFSVDFFDKYLEFIKQYVEKFTKNENYENIMHSFITETGSKIYCESIGDLQWQNVNYAYELELANLKFSKEI